jgi:hypothetical protein
MRPFSECRQGLFQGGNSLSRSFHETMPARRPVVIPFARILRFSRAACRILLS